MRTLLLTARSLSPRELLAPAFYLVSAIILVWDVFLASRIATIRKLPPVFTGVTALAGLLIAPALLVAVASGSAITGRAIFVIAWLWPLTLALFAVQAIYAMWKRLVVPIIGVPVVLYDLLLLGVGVTRFIVVRGGSPPLPALALDAAEASTLGLALGHAALLSPFALQLPLLAPVYPSRWGIGIPLRALLATVAAVSAALMIIEYPPGFMAVRSYARFDGDRLQERKSADFLVGLRIFPDVRNGPPPVALRNDLALVDTLGPDAVSVIVAPEGVTAAALDSLSRSIDELRRDSVLLVVALGYPAHARARFRAAPAAYMQARVREVEQLTLRLRPDYLLPAVDPYGDGAREMGSVPFDWWRQYLTQAAAAAHRARPRTRVGVSIAAFTGRDSLLYAWAAGRGSPMDVVGFTLYPSYTGAMALAARMRVADQWMRGRDKEHWVFAAGGYPLMHGEENQERALWGTLAWGTSHRRVHGVILEAAGDYGDITGLRAPGGRLRPAVAAIERAMRALAEAAAGSGSQ